MSDLITFRLSADHARALVALGADQTAPALARAAADLVWQQISGPMPTTDAPRRSAPARTLRPLPGVDYSRHDDTAPIGPARAAKLAELLQAADPVGMARALTGRDLRDLGEVTQREGMQLLDIQNHRRAQLAAAQQQAQQPAPRLTRARARAAVLAQQDPAAYGAALLR